MGYLKLRRPFASKSENIRDTYFNELANDYKTLESAYLNYVKTLNHLKLLIKDTDSKIASGTVNIDEINDARVSFTVAARMFNEILNTVNNNNDKNYFTLKNGNNDWIIPAPQAEN